MSAREYVAENELFAMQAYVRGVPERHRQALYRTQTAMVDYFIFNDLDQIPIPRCQLDYWPLEYQKIMLQQARIRGEVHTQISMPTPEVKKSLFNDLINSCLSLGFAAGALHPRDCGQLYDWIVEELQKLGKWDAAMCERLCVQMGFEFGYKATASKRLMFSSVDSLLLEKTRWRDEKTLNDTMQQHGCQAC